MEQSSVMILLRRLGIPSVQAVRLKTRHFKPKIAAVRSQKTPSMLALDHFDFYYGPLYGPKHWPSIRLGLLNPNKFIAVLNRLSEDVEANEAILRELSTVNVIEMLTQGSKPPPKPKDFKGIPNNQLNENQNEMQNEQDSDHRSRLEGGMDSFQQPVDEFRYGQLQTNPDNLKKTLDDDVVITGLEHVGVQLSKIDDKIVYPRDLKLFAYARDDISDFPAPMKDKNGISSWWLLDGASVVPVLALNLRKSDKILDMCAAPGGKSLIMAQIGNFDQLVCNDDKLSRLGQLRRGLSMYIPVGSELNQKIVLKRKDGSNLDNWNEENLYDKVLVDAPCSTDRLSVNQDEGNMFSIGMTQERLNLPQLQTKLLLNALRAVKVGGSVVYSTCALAPTQNECVIDNTAALARQHFGIEIVEQSLAGLQNQLRNTHLFRFSEKCQRGTLIVPYIRSNFGPMYVCKLLRIK